MMDIDFGSKSKTLLLVIMLVFSLKNALFGVDLSCRPDSKIKVRIHCLLL